MYLLISRDLSYGNAWLVTVNKGYAMHLSLIVALARAIWRNRKANAGDQARVLQSPPAGCSAWIAVDDRFPDDMRDVMTFGRYGVHKACFEWGTEDDPCWWSDEVRKADFKESVTHWAELPNDSVTGANTAYRAGGARIRVDRPWAEYPIGTRAYACNGGWWERVEGGWKPNLSKDVFPGPGGDAVGECIELSNNKNRGVCPEEKT